MTDDEPTERVPVLVIGAGPVGMSAALALRARGLPATILEADPEDRDRSGSRAIYVHGATLRTLEHNHPGLGKQLAEAGLVWPTRRTLFRGEEVFSRTYPDEGGSEGLPHFTSLPQVRTEEFMLEACREAGVDVHWDSPAETVDSSDEGVRVVTEDGEVWEADYVVGADGARGPTREEIGAEFQGDRSENSYIIVDIEALPDDPREIARVFHYEHPKLDGRNVLIVPFQGGWRLDIQCRVSDDPEAMSQDDVVADMVEKVMGEEYAERVTWVSTYQFLQVIADSFVDAHRRVLLAGEAAHLFAPFGARGMNSGIADADSAASAIKVAIDAESPAVARDEIEKFAAERETAAEWNRDAAGAALRHLRGDGVVINAKKRLAAEAADWWEPAGEWLDEAPYGPSGGPPIPTGTKY